MSPASACGRPLLLEFAYKGIAAHVSRPRVCNRKVRFPAKHRKPSPLAGGRPLGKLKEEAVAAGGGRGTFAQGPAAR